MRSKRRADHTRASGLAQFGHAAGVVGVVVGDEDRVQSQAFLASHRVTPVGLARVHDQRLG
jgi:hypothetical protein